MAITVKQINFGSFTAKVLDLGEVSLDSTTLFTLPAGSQYEISAFTDDTYVGNRRKYYFTPTGSYIFLRRSYDQGIRLSDDTNPGIGDASGSTKPFMFVGVDSLSGSHFAGMFGARTEFTSDFIEGPFLEDNHPALVRIVVGASDVTFAGNQSYPFFYPVSSVYPDSTLIKYSSALFGTTPLWGHSINFVTNGGSPVESLTGRTALPDPLPITTRDGFAFTGWYTDSSLVFPAVPGASITEDTTLYAGWRPNQFTITFETNGGEPVSQLTNVNQLPDPLPTTLKVGNDFAGWFTDSELLHPAVPGAVISQNTTLYAKWVEQQSTDIHVPTVSTPSLLQTGFVTMWNPTLEEVRELSNFLWTTNLFDNLRKLFNDPMEAILFLGIVPFDVNTAERSNIYFGNLDTDVESSPVVQQYYTLDFGDIDMTEYYHSFLDYEPATTVEIFLPFCGTHKLSANEVMGSVMNLKYNVDVFTGTCVAMLTITKPGIDSVMYSFEGNLMATIPVTAKNYSDFIRSVVGSVALVGAML